MRIDIVYASFVVLGCVLGVINSGRLGPECGWPWFILAGTSLFAALLFRGMNKLGLRNEAEIKRLKDKYENK